MRMRIFWILIGGLVWSSHSVSTPLLEGDWFYVAKQSSDINKVLKKRLEYIDSTAARLATSGTNQYVVGSTRVRPTQEQIQQVLEFIDAIVPLNPLIAIEHDDPSLTLRYKDGRVRTVYTDGRDSDTTIQTTAKNIDQKLVFAAWEKKALVIETNSNSGTTIIERFKRDKGENQLNIIMTINSVRLPKSISLEYVYFSINPDSPVELSK